MIRSQWKMMKEKEDSCWKIDNKGACSFFWGWYCWIRVPFGCCHGWFFLVLCLAAFRRHQSIESLCIFAIVIDHVVVSNPLHLTLLTKTQLLVYGGSPPVGRGRGGTLSSAKRSIPLASPCPEVTESGYEGCTIPVDLDKATSSCPVISIPQTGVNPHPLLIWVVNTFALIVSEDAYWQIINVPPEGMVSV